LACKSPAELGLDPDPEKHPAGSPEAIYVEAYRNSESTWMLERLRWDAEPTYCGMSWVRIRPARGPFVSFCKRHGMGERGVYGGYELTATANYHGQSMDLRSAACEGFVNVLRKYGLKAYTINHAD
jgi:hypothetical protein